MIPSLWSDSSASLFPFEGLLNLHSAYLDNAGESLYFKVENQQSLLHLQPSFYLAMQCNLFAHSGEQGHQQNMAEVILGYLWRLSLERL